MGGGVDLSAFSNRSLGYTPQFQAKINNPREKLMYITLTLYRFVPPLGIRGPIFLCIYKKSPICQYPGGLRLGLIPTGYFGI